VLLGGLVAFALASAIYVLASSATRVGHCWSPASRRTQAWALVLVFLGLAGRKAAFLLARCRSTAASTTHRAHSVPAGQAGERRLHVAFMPDL